MMTSQQPSSAAFPAKQRPDAMPTVGTRPESAAKPRKLGVSRPATVGTSMSLGRPPPPSAKSTTGTRHCAESASIGSSFLWLIQPWVPAKTV